MNRKVFLFFLLCLFVTSGAIAQSLTAQLRELYIKKSNGVITQSDYETGKAELMKASQETSLETSGTTRRTDLHSVRKTKKEDMTKNGNPEKNLKQEGGELQFSLKQDKKRSFNPNTKSEPSLKAELQEVVLVIFCSKYWKAHEMVQLSQDIQLQVNGSRFSGETIDEDSSYYSYFTSKFVMQLPKGVYECNLVLPIERRLAYGNQNNRFGKWCLKKCEFKFSLVVNEPTREIRVVDFFKKAYGIANFEVGEKFLTKAEYDSLLSNRKDQERQEQKSKAFYAALAVIVENSQASYSQSYVPVYNNAQKGSIRANYNVPAVQTTANPLPVLPQLPRNQFNPENSPFNPRNSEYNPSNSQFNPKNSSFNPNNSIFNPKNSEFNPQNSPHNPMNSPFNPTNSQFNYSRNAIINSNGQSIGYFTPKTGGGYNLFNNDGNRIGYTNANSRGLFDQSGNNMGHIVPKSDGNINLFVR